MSPPAPSVRLWDISNSLSSWWNETFSWTGLVSQPLDYETWVNLLPTWLGLCGLINTCFRSSRQLCWSRCPSLPHLGNSTSLVSVHLKQHKIQQKNHRNSAVWEGLGPESALECSTTVIHSGLNVRESECCNTTTTSTPPVTVWFWQLEKHGRGRAKSTKC